MYVPVYELPVFVCLGADRSGPLGRENPRQGGFTDVQCLRYEYQPDTLRA